ncbi:MAG: membrane protein insertase YidC [Tannerellaceae bacterium]|nr:membrane protein insertase YidC [Tannerellaceae bacterium]
MDKNTIIGFVLIGVVLFAFNWLTQPTPEQIEAQRRYQDSIAQVVANNHLEVQQQAATTENQFDQVPDSVRKIRLQQNFGSFASAMTGVENYTTLENEVLELTISNKGGRVYSARLKDYKTYDGDPLILFEGKDASLDFSLVTTTNRVISTADLYFQPVGGNDPNTLVMRLNAGEGGYLDFVYTVQPNEYRVNFSIQSQGLNDLLLPTTHSLDMAWQQKVRQQEKGRKYENQYTSLVYKFLAGDFDHLSEGKDESKQLANRLKWIGYKDKFFTTALIANEYFESTTVDSKGLIADGYLKEFRTTASVPFDLQGRESTDFTWFFGPNKYSLLKSYDKGVAADQQLDMERLVPLGAFIFRWVNKYFIVPLFDFLGRFISSYGLIIFLMTLIVKIVLLPLTYKSYMSTAKMRVLRPQVEEINAKYPGQEQAMERQKATMELYSRTGASPMSGCLPMLLQMPVLIALFSFFPASIELRQQSFLWASDLSTYDAVISWNANVPFISNYFGNHISLFCMLMVITNLIYNTKFNMDQTNTGQQQMPGMKAMMYMMPLMFLVFFNQYASGLTYYYFISTLMTIVQILLFRYTINEDKLLAKLEANKQKLRKKSSFMKRLEEAQKMQQEQLKKQQGQKKKR